MWIIDIILNLIVMGSRKGSRAPMLFVVCLAAIVLIGTLVAIVAQSSVG
jgi:hypothetical protein